MTLYDLDVLLMTQNNAIGRTVEHNTDDHSTMIRQK